MTAFLNALKAFLQQYWPGLAVAFFDYEESRVDHEAKEKEAAQLQVRNLQDEKTIRDSFAGKSDADIINEFASGGTREPGKPKPGGS